MFFKIVVLKNFAIFVGKHLCWNYFLIKLQASLFLFSLFIYVLFIFKFQQISYFVAMFILLTMNDQIIDG